MTGTPVVYDIECSLISKREDESRLSFVSRLDGRLGWLVESCWLR
jgi:hypothetical protein